MVNQSTKDYSSLQNQRSALNIGVVVGNLLSGLFKKGVELVNEFEESIQTSFVIECRVMMVVNDDNDDVNDDDDDFLNQYLIYHA